ncbi:MAG: BrnA antitoxin family protein [Candidatus Binatia bacterium]
MTSPRKLNSPRLPTDVIERWRATGTGWQTRVAALPGKGPCSRRRPL